ncbi:uncharacterized protein M421DRAFT_63411 [Didymella exigua CBS 183.55]|uniref:Nuclear condensin complex subunit 3 C-terminal domain-containing protein n=1 Tax=Didymella exigua CBS 183.55 TaxID=1150837 RepID=A0A6A5RIX7_9PLEO|nr:uncharacterized protein M421DRAFT_63411 [Didymella exigua CBS 183.55]KAF1928325.1 hypothetical protein M421DRAFT_63411 [Didymella exigua CBS 183.55]
MPGRTATRSTRTARAGAGTKSARSSTMDVPDEGPVTSLRTRIAHVFSDASKTTATQRKLVVTLRKIQEQCCFEPPDTNKGRNDDRETFEEDDFTAEMGRVVLRVMNVKKSEAAGDRVIRFLTTFLKYAVEKDAKVIDETSQDDGTPSSRLSVFIIKTVLPLLQSKDKTVRFRATQTITQLLNNLEAIDEDMYSLIISSLTKRLRDKEASVRVQAVMGLGRLANDEEDEEDEDSDDEASTILEKLVDIMQNDPDAQVRRTILANIPFFKSTIVMQLERARDVDPATRRLVYARILPILGDFRHLSLVQREKMIRWGLKDRDDAVRKATAQLFSERWIEDCASRRDTRPEEEKAAGSTAPPSLEALCELLERLDIIRAGQEEGMAHEAMRQFWARRPDYVEAIEFSHQFWLDLDPSAAFVARSLNDYAQSIDDEQTRQMIEDKIPEPHNFGFVLERKLNDVAEFIDRYAMLDEDDPDAADAQEEVQDAEFVAEQVLHMAMSLDFSDEVGRRNVYSITRTALALASLPEECTKLCIELLRIVCGNRGESDFCAVIMEAVNEVHDTLSDDPNDASGAGDDAESFHSAQSEHSSPLPARRKTPKPAKTAEEEAADKWTEIMVYSKCLHILQCTLQNVTCDLESDTNLKTALNTLIIPAVQSKENIIRERGVICLGLASLLSKDLAVNNLDLFFHCFTKGNDELKQITLQVIADVIITHPHLLAPPASDPDTTEQSEVPEQSPLLRPLRKILLKGITSEDTSVGRVACEAAQKLILHSLLPEEETADIVRALTLTYFDPDGQNKPAMIQALGYFLPVFCHSRIKNAQTMAGVAVSVIGKLLVMRDDVDEDEDAAEMVGWPRITAYLADLTDGRKVVGQTETGSDGKTSSSGDSEVPHIMLAVEILERALNGTCSRDERKPLLALLTKLHIPPSAPQKTVSEPTAELLEALQALVSEAVEDRIGVDATQRNALTKLDATLTKRLGDAATAAIAPEDREATVTPEAATARATPAEEARSSRARSSVAPSVDGSDMDVDVDDEDSMLAGMQGESTRMPLEPDDGDDDGDSTPRASRVRSAREATAKTEADIVDELLASDEEMSM